MFPSRTMGRGLVSTAVVQPYVNSSLTWNLNTFFLAFALVVTLLHLFRTDRRLNLEVGPSVIPPV